jgi:LL-diaminopimelate aminotransferase
VGNKTLVAGLTKVKSQIDSGPPVYTQRVAVKALGSYISCKPPEFLKKNNLILQERRDLLVDTFTKLGYKVEKPKATFYVWVNCKGDSMQFAANLLNAGIAVTPGVGFGAHGEGYARITFTQPKERIVEACNRLASAL